MKKQPAERLAGWLERVSLAECRHGFGQPYPDVAAAVAGHVVVATLNPGKEYSAPDLLVYGPEAVVSWVRRIRRYRRRHPRCSLRKAVYETERSPS